MIPRHAINLRGIDILGSDIELSGNSRFADVRVAQHSTAASRATCPWVSAIVEPAPEVKSRADETRLTNDV